MCSAKSSKTIIGCLHVVSIDLNIGLHECKGESVGYCAMNQVKLYFYSVTHCKDMPGSRNHS